jgi:hypothetical protein
MALASRSARRSGAGSRWLLIGVVITLFVLLINASLQSRSPGPGQQLAAGAWVDRVLPIVTASTQEGQQLAAIWVDGLHTPADSLGAELSQVASGSAQAYQQVIALRPPANVAGAAGLLEACLLLRSEAAASLQGALEPLLAGSDGPGAKVVAAAPSRLSTIQGVGGDMQLGDQAYQLFVETLPKLGFTMPPSTWAGNLTPYKPEAATVFLSSLQNAMTSTPVREVKIYAVSTSPAAESIHNGVELLPDAPSLAVTVVLANVGNQQEKNLTVTASISPAGAASSVRDFVDLVPDQAQTIAGMGPLIPHQGPVFTLTITVAPGAGAAPLATYTQAFVMPAPPAPPPKTTTTTVAPSTAG